jgi:uncharacterized RDD family membrane protein YckC
MNHRKVIPLWLFRTIGITMLLINVIASAAFVLTESGPYAFITDLIGDTADTAILALLLTFIITCIPTLIIMALMRPFSQVPSFKSQMTDMGPLTAAFKTDVDTSQYGELPSVFSRVLAFIIDRGIVVLVIAIAGGIFVAIDEQLKSHGLLYYISLVFFLIVLFAGAVYSYSRDMFKGKSIARRLLKQKVVDISTGLPIGGWRSFKREIIIHFAPLILIELILISTNKARRRMGDNWAKTIVVKDLSA